MEKQLWDSLILKDLVLSTQKDIIPLEINEKFVNYMTSILNEEINDNNIDKQKLILLELFALVISGSIYPNHAVTLLKSISNLQYSKNDPLSSMIIDSLWLWGTQLHGEEMEKELNKWNKLCSLVKEIAPSGLIDITSLKVSLDLNLLVGAGITKDEVFLNKRLLKINTGLVYRQQKYNLLREETEGFSKLIVVLKSLPAYPDDISQYSSNILSLVGHFDLDPNRTLDIILDIFEHNIWNLSFIALIKMFGKDHIPHILGFKFSYYHQIVNSSSSSSTTITTDNKEEKKDNISIVTDDKNKSVVTDDKKSKKEDIKVDLTSSTAEVLNSPLITPESLYKLTAVLIASSIITVDDILPYLKPVVEDIKKITIDKNKDKVTEIKEFGLNKSATIDSNKLSSISKSSLLDIKKSTSSINIKEDNTENESLQFIYDMIPSHPYSEGNQIIGLLTALWSIRCWDIALPIVSLLKSHKIDAMLFADARKSLYELLIWSTDDLYASSSMRNLNLAAKTSRITNTNIPQLPGQLPQFTSMKELPKDISTLINFLGINLFYSPALFTQLCRLFTKHIQLVLSDLKSNNDNITVDKMKEMETIALQPVCDILSNIMLPALSAGESNAFLSSQLWTVLSLLPFDVRFQFYDNWRGNKIGKEAIGFKHNDQVLGETKALHYTRFHLKRLAKENTKLIGRSIGRYSNTCPIVCYSYILSQIESFDNLIPFVVESIKHSTPLARDCMAYCLIIQLQKEEDKLKKGDTHYSSWFSSLAKFIGTFYRKFPTTELKGLFHFMLEKLSRGETLDLLVLKELLVRMGGMETLMEVSQTQLEGLSGGRVLRSEVMNLGGEALSKKAMNTLRDELMASNTALPMLLFIAQVKSKILYNTETTQLKLISYLFDTCQEVLMQFTEFLVAGSKSIELIAKLMPSFDIMINEIGLAIPVAFQLVRPIVRAALQCGEDPSNSPEYLQKWHPYSIEMKSVMNTHLPEALWNYMSPELYITFWSLSLYDIRIPTARYELERKRLRERYTDLDTSRSAVVFTTVSEAEKANRVRKVEMTKILNTIKDLTDEQETQKKHMEWTRKILFSRKDSYFCNVNSDNICGIIDNIMQNCIYDRVRMNPLDSVYCNQFFLTLHELDTPGFSTINYLDKMIKTITPLIFSTTEAESSFIGYAMSDVLATIKPWLNSIELFEQEASTKCGFLNNQLNITNEENNAEMTKASYDEFTKVYSIWHLKIKQVLISSLSSKEYMYIRSALILLSKISLYFPTYASAGRDLIDCVTNVVKNESARADLQLMAQMSLTSLKRSSSSWTEDSKKKIEEIALAKIKAEKQLELDKLAAAEAELKLEEEKKLEKERRNNRLDRDTKSDRGDTRSDRGDTRSERGDRSDHRSDRTNENTNYNKLHLSDKNVDKSKQYYIDKFNSNAITASSSTTTSTSSSSVTGKKRKNEDETTDNASKREKESKDANESRDSNKEESNREKESNNEKESNKEKEKGKDLRGITKEYNKEKDLKDTTNSTKDNNKESIKDKDFKEKDSKKDLRGKDNSKDSYKGSGNDNRSRDNKTSGNTLSASSSSSSSSSTTTTTTTTTAVSSNSNRGNDLRQSNISNSNSNLPQKRGRDDNRDQDRHNNRPNQPLPNLDHDKDSKDQSRHNSYNQGGNRINRTGPSNVLPSPQLAHKPDQAQRDLRDTRNLDNRGGNSTDSRSGSTTGGTIDSKINRDLRRDDNRGLHGQDNRSNQNIDKNRRPQNDRGHQQDRRR